MNLRPSIQITVILCAALLFAGCVKDVSIADQAADKTVIEAIIEVGEPVVEVYIHGLRGVIEDQVLSNLNITLNGPVEEVTLSPIPARPGYYEGIFSNHILPESSYTLTVERESEVISAEATTPPSMAAFSSSKEYLDATLSGDLVFLEWTGVNTGSVNEYFYVIELIPLEEDAEELRNSYGESSPSRVVSFTSEITLSVDVFNFFGDHSIEVFAISKDFEALYVAQPDAGLNGPSNIQNGYGYFLGASVIQGSLEIR